MLRGLAYLLAGTEVRRFPDGVLPDLPVAIGVPPVYVWSLTIAAVSALVLGGFLRFSRLGVALRATADDQQATLADFGLLVLPVAILGGLDSLSGAIVGGLVMGVLQNVASSYLDPCVGGGLKIVFPYVALVGILLLKPSGLFGRVQIERV